MKALVKEAPGFGLSYMDIPQPEITNPDDVLFKVEYCAISLEEAKIYTWNTWAAQDKQLSLPAVLGHEASGIVVAVGDAVQGLQPGDRITIESLIFCGECFQCRSGRTNLCPNMEIFGKKRGAFAEYAVVPARVVHKLPDNLSLQEGALLDNLGLAVHAVEMARVQPGDWVVVIGSTPVGVLTTQVLQAQGINVLVSDIVDGRLERLHELTGAPVISGNTEAVQHRLMEMTGGQEADAAILNLGVDMLLEQAFDVVRNGGTVVTLAAFTRPVEVDLYRHMTCREINLVGAVGRAEKTWQTAMQLVESGAVNYQRLIAMAFPMDDYVTAFEFVRSGAVMKILIQPGAHS